MEDITISELYSKYTSGIEELENDRYFQYLFEMIQAGDNTLQQKNRVLHKVVDERWLTVVEEGIEAIFHIVEKPRRFIATTEEVVPVALAKKITADSVRHLSQNTQFITSNEAGEIQPTRILNVTSEESFDLYENRFVYHLIQRLFAFVDKRTDIIFWSTGDETCNVMSMESKIDDAYEEMSYTVEMTIKNRQSYAENDTDHMDIFKRIDRVRRLSRTLRTSSFCDIMGGCAKVYSPIQRTNLMMKDPDYRKCYQLWQFIEGYDEVGYTIEEQDSALQFDEEYLLQMYIHFITNYTVFKSILESDERNVKELAREKREPVKPKFVKEIREEIVEDRNLPDVEIRKVFVEEVTEAQLKAEADLKKEKERSADLESSLSETEFQLNSVSQQLDFLEQELAQVRQEKEALAAAQKEKEDRIAKAEKKAEEEKTAAINEAKEKAQKEIAEEKAKAMEQIERAKMQQQTAEEEAEKECRKWKKRSEDAQREAKKAREEKEKKQKAATEAITKAQEEVKRIRQEAEKAAEEAKNQLIDMQKEKDRALAKAEADTLSHYLLKVLKERKERKKDREEDRENK